GPDAATAIMTTDTVPKEVVVERGGWHVGGMAKGAGMLAPGLATMLCVLTTDAVVTAEDADTALRAATTLTFDRVDSDGCMSSNDPNWGRVLSAVGTVPVDVAPVEADAVDVAINGVTVCRAGGVGEDRSLVDLAAAREVRVDIDLHAGDATATIWTNDLTHDY